MGDFRSIFEAYGGDYDETMLRFMGKEDLYRRILSMLFQDDNIKKLGETLKEGNLDGAFEAAHTLKGVSGNLGLAPFYESLCRIIEPLRVREQRDDYGLMYQKVQDEFFRVEGLWKDLQNLE